MCGVDQFEIKMIERSFNRVVIDTSALEDNFRFIQQKAGAATPVMAMVKADGYGHGMIQAAAAFSRAGCVNFGVAELAEGVLLRQKGIKGQIYITIGFSPSAAAAILDYDLIPVVYDISQVEALATTALDRGVEVGVHLKVDTGMSRLGISVAEVFDFVNRIDATKGVFLAGVMSHVPESDDTRASSTNEAIAKFTFICKELKRSSGAICHIANSGAVINFPDACYDMVRAGIALYGYHPAGQDELSKHPDGALIPAMSFRTQVLQVKHLSANQGISYGHTYKTEKESIIAVLPVGYEDGFSRGLSNRGVVLVRGQKVPIRGRVCMNMTMVDVTEIEGVTAGEEVVLMGTQNSCRIDADTIAGLVNSISYEILCMIGNNNSREYIKAVDPGTD